MILTKKIENDELAFYVSYNPMCLSCNMRYEEISNLEKLLKNIKFYAFDVFEGDSVLQDLKISKTPFFMISRNGIVIDIFYVYPNLERLYLKLYKLLRSEKNDW